MFSSPFVPCQFYCLSYLFTLKWSVLGISTICSLQTWSERTWRWLKVVFLDAKERNDSYHDDFLFLPWLTCALSSLFRNSNSVCNLRHWLPLHANFWNPNQSLSYAAAQFEIFKKQHDGNPLRMCSMWIFLFQEKNLEICRWTKICVVIYFFFLFLYYSAIHCNCTVYLYQVSGGRIYKKWKNFNVRKAKYKAQFGSHKLSAPFHHGLPHHTPILFFSMKQSDLFELFIFMFIFMDRSHFLRFQNANNFKKHDCDINILFYC